MSAPWLWPQVGEVWQNPRGRRYRIVAVEPDGRGLVLDLGRDGLTTTSKPEGAYVSMICAANGWGRVS